MKHAIPFFITSFLSFWMEGHAQQTKGWLLDKMPADLETEYALSSLPSYLRADASVYLLDPTKGYYLARKGSNGFVAYVNRTEWERAEFVQDTYAALGFDAEGAKTLLPVFMDVAAMRATGKYSPLQLRDSIIQRVKYGKYKAPGRAGICYMLSPVHRTRQDDKGIVNMVMPHYMFYAPYVDDSDVGGRWVSGGHQPFVASSAKILDKEHCISNFIIIAAGKSEKARIIEEEKNLIKKMGEYKSFLKTDTDQAMTEHHH